MTGFMTLPSPVGDLLLVASQGALQRIVFLDTHATPPEPDWVEDPEALAPVATQLEEYFRGERRDFDLELEPAGTEFQRAVWSLVLEIPFGRTATYGDIARRLGRPDATRAVGAANGKNPLPIVIPCHRVIGQDGSLTGFGGGMRNKRWLLEHEGAASVAQMALPLEPH
jgi:methylated-DNA-[protein]-cysteine S-methyltransferase